MAPRNTPTDRDGNPARHGTQDKIERLRRRLYMLEQSDRTTAKVGSIIKGMLDLLEDELAREG